ncbi:MAG TPA: response regulator transcription factor [Anaerolineaceae bacterium]|nr:response regulator transcription factor [Anaerolineaceae bacterium]
MKTLIVEDDKTLADILAFTFVREGYEVIQAFSGSDALQLWEEENPDLMVLDINIPSPDGFSVCETIRRHNDTPIIFLSVRNDEEDIVQGLDVGADDYITKPFSPRQLMARVEAVLRRSSPTIDFDHYSVGTVYLNLNLKTISIPNKDPIPLSESECKFVLCIMRYAGQVVTSQILINCIWGSNNGNKEMLRQLVHRLRIKISELQTSIPIIETITGVGYCFNKQF